jgi:hypothetical protein
MFGRSAVRLVVMVSAGFAFGYSANAATFHVRTSAGHPVRVSNEVAWDEKCNSQGTPQYTFTTKPAHGEISTRSEDKVIKTCEVGACNCIGRHIAGAAIYYTPDKNFHGTDQFSFSSHFPNGKELNHQGIIDVN